MVVTLQASGGGTVTLADDSAGDFVTFDEREHERQVQPDKLFQAAAESTAARGNLRNTVGFQVDKKLADLNAALAFWSDWPDSIPGQGILKWSNGTTTRFLKDAALKAVRQVRLNGIEVVFHYTFTGGLITNS